MKKANRSIKNENSTLRRPSNTRTQWVWALAMIAIALLSYAVLMRDIRITLWPHAQVLHYLYGLDFTFISGTGYVEQSGYFAITAGCMGAKLFVGAFLLVTLGFMPHAGSTLKEYVRYAITAYGLVLAGAFAITILRIAISLPFCTFPNAQLIHNIISLVIYFGSMACLFI